MANNGFNAAKVSVFRTAFGVFALEGYNFLTRDARRTGVHHPVHAHGVGVLVYSQPSGIC